MSENQPDLAFKFRFVQNGQTSGLFTKPGSAGSAGLVIDGQPLSYQDIQDTATVDNRLVLQLDPQAPGRDKWFRYLIAPATSTSGGHLAIEVRKVGAQTLERYINRRCSAREIEQQRQRLTESGKAHLFRTTTCPSCQALIDLSELERSSYTYCRFCDTVFRDGSKDPAAPQPPSSYRICTECAMFDRVKGYTEFYFYFVLVAYGFSYKRRHICDGCAGRLFWKTFFANLLFLLGLPSAIAIKLKSLRGRDPELKQLSAANALARKGRIQEAAAVYETLYQRHPDHPGLLFNQSLGHLAGQDPSGALAYAQRSVKACRNYLPAQRLVQQLTEPKALPAP